MRNSRYLHIILIILFAASIFPSCSTKKNTPATRHYQSFITRYNVYYNGDKHYIEQIDKMENSYQDDYSSGRVYIHPVEALTNSKAPQPGTNYDRTIEKMQKAIQLHSIKISPKRDRNKMRDPRYREYVKRGEFNPFIHNAWYLMAQAQYYNGDFLGASSTFKYIAKNFTWMPELVTNCTLWEMRSYTTMGWMTEASNIAERIKPTDIITTENREIYNITFADYYLKEGKIKEAVPFLENAINDTNKGQHTRLNFLLGEVYAEIGDNPKAYAAFQQAAKSSSATYRTKFNARIKQSEVFSKADISTEVKSLKRMTNYDRNKEYLDQIYYAIANLHLTRGDTANAVSNYILSIEKSTRNGIDKALSQIKLGELYYETQQYDLAQPCYTEAVPQLPETFLNYAQIKLRSEILDELAVFAQNVTLQDSLLTLSAMTPEEQTKVAERLIAELEKQEKEQQEEMARQEFIAQQAAQGNNRPNQNNAPTTFQVSSSDNSWYFYNSSTKSAGKTEFQKRWGSRKLEDNWRRINKTTFSMDEFDESNYDEDGNLIDNQDESEPLTEEEQISKEDAKRMDDPHYVEYYLKQIPKTEAEIQISKDIIQEGLFNIGLILKDKLEDYNSAAIQFNRLLTDYPYNVYKLDIYYNMYLMYMRINETVRAEKYRQLILTEFTESMYGVALLDENYIDNLRNMDREQEEIYLKAYNAYLNNDNAMVHAVYEQMMRKYPLSKIMPKFMFIDALSYVTEKNFDKFRSTLTEMLERYPETDITPVASSMLKQIAQGRKLEGGSSNMRGIYWSTRLSNDSTGVSLDAELTPFEADLDKPQLLVLVFPVDTVSSNNLLFEIAKHNFNSFVVKDFDLEQMNFGPMGLIIIKGFANFDELTHYRSVLNSNSAFIMPKEVKPVMISVNNFQLLLNEGRSFEEYFNFMEENSFDDVEERALGVQY